MNSTKQYQNELISDLGYLNSSGVFELKDDKLKTIKLKRIDITNKILVLISKLDEVKVKEEEYKTNK